MATYYFKILVIYLLAINFSTFVIYGIDKQKAKSNTWRVPESRLLLMAVFGGSIGALIGMKVWHHKTKHKKFAYGIPFILAAQIIAAASLCCTSCRSSSSTIAQGTYNNEDAVTVIVYYDAAIGNNAIEQFIKDNHVTVVYRYTNINGYALRLHDKSLRDKLAKVKGVLSVQDDQIMHLH